MIIKPNAKPLWLEWLPVIINVLVLTFATGQITAEMRHMQRAINLLEGTRYTRDDATKDFALRDQRLNQLERFRK